MKFATDCDEFAHQDPSCAFHRHESEESPNEVDAENQGAELEKTKESEQTQEEVSVDVESKLDDNYFANLVPPRFRNLKKFPTNFFIDYIPCYKPSCDNPSHDHVFDASR